MHSGVIQPYIHVYPFSASTFYFFQHIIFWLYWVFIVVHSESCSVMADSLRPHRLYSSWNSLGQNSGVRSLSLLQGILLWCIGSVQLQRVGLVALTHVGP